MRVVVVSDTHKLESELQMPEGDVLIHAGDWGMRGSREEFEDFSMWLKLQPYSHICCAAGNHDKLAEKNWDLAVEILGRAKLLHNEAVIIDGVKFYGCSTTPTFGYGWAFMKNRGPDIAEDWALIPDDTDVLITHGPPYGILDEVEEWPGAYKNVGCEDLRKRVDQLSNLKLHCFGHLHLMGGKTKQLGNTIFANAAMVNEDYKVVNEPLVFDI